MTGSPSRRGAARGPAARRRPRGFVLEGSTRERDQPSPLELIGHAGAATTSIRRFGSSPHDVRATGTATLRDRLHPPRRRRRRDLFAAVGTRSTSSTRRRTLRTGPSDPALDAQSRRARGPRRRPGRAGSPPAGGGDAVTRRSSRHRDESADERHPAGRNTSTALSTPRATACVGGHTATLRVVARSRLRRTRVDEPGRRCREFGSWRWVKPSIGRATCTRSSTPSRTRTRCRVHHP